MITKDLIKELQRLVEAHKCVEDMMGPHEIVIDVFVKTENDNFRYAGFSPNIKIEKSSDGVYDILNAFGENKYEIKRNNY